MSTTRRDADHLLAPEQFSELNEAFYRTRPWGYFEHRLRALMLTAGAPDKLLDLLREPVQHGRVQIRYDAEDDAEGLARAEEDRKRFLIAEGEVLLHHVSETLLRLYLAHEPLGECPWLDLARVRNPGAFKDLVTDRFASDLSADERRERIANVFFGRPEPEWLAPAPPPDEWKKGADNIEAFLSCYAHHFLEADVYNSLKHGLAVRPGDALMQLGDPELLKAEGPSIEYLSIRRDQSGNSRWNRSTKWVKPDRDIALIYIASRLIESLWSMAAYRYTNEPPKQLNLWTKPTYTEVLRQAEGEEQNIVMDTAHMQLLYYKPPQPSDGVPETPDSG